MKKGERNLHLMGIRSTLYCNNNGKWVITAPLAVREQFNNFLHQLLEEDLVNCSQTSDRIHVETRFTNIKELMKKLRQPKIITG